MLLGCEEGAIFEEVFTHKGRGTLFSDYYSNVIRRAVSTDAKGIALLIKAHQVDRLVLPMSEEEVFNQIESFYVHSVNEALVTVAKLTDYGECAELAKFCTLPSYQRRGRANELALNMIDEARRQGKRAVFALSIAPKMWEFFESLGFKDIPREELPDKWKEHYDFSRPSKALMMLL